MKKSRTGFLKLFLKSLSIFCLSVFSSPVLLGQEMSLAEKFSRMYITGEPSLSSDANRFTFLWDITGKKQVWVAEFASTFPLQLTFLSEEITFVEWVPKHELILFGAKTGAAGTTQLYLIKPNGSDLKRITSKDSAEYRFKAFSNDGKWMAYEANARKANILDAYTMNLETLERRLIAAEDDCVRPISFSPDASYLLLSKGNQAVNNDLYLADLKTLKQVLLTKHKGNAIYHGGDWTPDGNALYVSTTENETFHTLALLTLVKYRRSVVRGKLSPISLGKYDLAEFHLSNDGKYFSYTLLQDGYSRTVVQNLKTRRTIELDDADDVISADFTEDSKLFVLKYGSATNVTQTVLYEPETKKVKPLTFYNYAGLWPKDFVRPQSVHYISFDKEEIPAFLYMPKGAKVDSSLTMVVLFHDGVHSRAKPYFNLMVQFLVANNYAVMMPDVRGAFGYGLKYAEADDQAAREAALKDAASAVSWIQMSGLANPKKVVAMGCGYGGYLAQSIAAQNASGWAAAISINGFADLAEFVRTKSAFEKNALAIEFGEPETNADLFKKFSPIHFAAQIKMPVLWIAEKQQAPQAAEEAKKMQSAAQKNGVKSEALLLESACGQENLKRTFEKVAAFLENQVRNK
ncbi:peptidase S9 prolyl oligopeptidase active site domain protein [Chloroherpeton thalassium ATCC 35110]|uniref:Peptidase S9 prolyl oligopeptidase active site domain protein n=1 Tax=Chloroherpeton thalassium (strain ATCC 35110 / GB-78) TaxID=517418 RepID=B3QSQ4_CHLT3|nr:prolyl oligopeptidase family serine peptidase [Chloroherpeton thalassium]ACF14101.1 peptidase S9 prolyl oligopeptidase active site domain protein [Chloroherpeton thalassium ATCC 35110]